MITKGDRFNIVHEDRGYGQYVMSGPYTCTAVSEENPNVPIVEYTGSSSGEELKGMVSMSKCVLIEKNELMYEDIPFWMAIQFLEHKIYRTSWPDDCHLKVIHPNGEDTLTEPYLAKRYGSGKCIPWTPNQEDLFAEDWCVL